MKNKTFWQYRQFGTIAWFSTAPKKSKLETYEQFEEYIRKLGFD